MRLWRTRDKSGCRDRGVIVWSLNLDCRFGWWAVCWCRPAHLLFGRQGGPSWRLGRTGLTA